MSVKYMHIIRKNVRSVGKRKLCDVAVYKVDIVQVRVELSVLFNKLLHEVDCSHMLGLLRQDTSESSLLEKSVIRIRKKSQLIYLTAHILLDCALNI
jgi:hypothetical protein